MNFFGHAWFAAKQCEAPAFVLGAMLPDLAPMAGLRIGAIDDPEIEAGAAYHMTCDGAFHRAPGFATLVAESSRALQSAGVRRGPARGAAHVGVELLLDGWIAEDRGVPGLYDEALASAATLSSAIQLEAVPGSIPLAELCQRIRRSYLPQAYSDPGFTTARIARALSRRPRLAFAGTERDIVARWLDEIAPELGKRAAPLLAHVAGAVGVAAGSPV